MADRTDNKEKVDHHEYLAKVLGYQIDTKMLEIKDEEKLKKIYKEIKSFYDAHYALSYIQSLPHPPDARRFFSLEDEWNYCRGVEGNAYFLANDLVKADEASKMIFFARKLMTS